MNFKKNTLALAILGSLFSSTTFAAAVDLSATPIVPAEYAKELTAANTTLTNAANALDLKGKIGWGVTANNHLYIRIDLTNGQFVTPLVGTDLSVNSAGPATVSLSSGGTAASTSVIFDVTDTANPILLSNDFTLAPANLKIIDPNQVIGVTVKFYTDSTLAATNGTALSTLSGNYVKTSSAVVTKFTPDTTTILASTSFKGFAASKTSGGPAAGNKALLGTIATGLASPTPLKPSTGAAVVGSDLATGIDLVLTGQFGAAGTTGSVFTSLTAGCTSAAAATLNTAKTTATFTSLAKNSATLVNTNQYLCFQADGQTAIPAQTISGTATYTGQVVANSIAAATDTAGILKRDGAELRSTWFSTATGYISRFALTNSGTADAPYNATVITEDGNTCTTGPAVTGSIKAGKQLIINATDICSTFTGSSRAAMTIMVDAPNNTIEGTYNIVNPTTGSVSVGQMVRPSN